MGGYAAATTIGVSGPIAIVVAGLLIGNHGPRLAMSERTRAHIGTFRELVDSILSAVLLVLIGLEVLLPRHRRHPRRVNALPPSSSMSRLADSRPSLPRAISATRAPAFANASAVARPTPAEAPVTTTVLSLKPSLDVFENVLNNPVTAFL